MVLVLKIRNYGARVRSEGARWASSTAHTVCSCLTRADSPLKGGQIQLRIQMVTCTTRRNTQCAREAKMQEYRSHFVRALLQVLSRAPCGAQQFGDHVSSICSRKSQRGSGIFPSFPKMPQRTGLVCFTSVGRRDGRVGRGVGEGAARVHA